MAPTAWTGFETVDLVDEQLRHSGRTFDYWPGRLERRRMAVEFINADDGPAALAFARRWGPLLPAAPGSLDELERARREGPQPVTEFLASWLFVARNLRTRRHDALDGTDETRRAVAEDVFLEYARGMGLTFAEGGGLVPLLVPRSLVDLVAVSVLEEIRAVGPVLQCLNWPSFGCRKTVPPRQGPRGRLRRYCSEACAARARSARNYARRRTAKEANGGR